MRLNDKVMANEQRMCKRYKLHCLVTFGEQQGWSKDISAAGIYFSTQKNLDEKEAIRLTVHFPREPAIQCEGNVVIDPAIK